MNCVDQQLVLDLVGEESGSKVRYLQEGVVLKGNLQDEKRNYTGSLILVQRPASTELFILWIPYTFLFCVAPSLVSPAARRTIGSETDLPLDLKSSTQTGDLVMKMEWMYTLVVPISAVAKMVRKSNLRGKRIVTITRKNGHIECPLIFVEGGMTQYVDELKRAGLIKQTNVNEFSTVEGAEMPQSPTASPLAAAGQNQAPPLRQFSSSSNNDNSATAPKTPTGASPTNLDATQQQQQQQQQHVDPVAKRLQQRESNAEAFHRDIYGSPTTVDSNKNVVSQVINIGHSLSKKGSKIVEALGSALIGSDEEGSSPNNSHSNAATRSGATRRGTRELESDSSFDICQPIVDVERVCPVVKSNSKRTLGPKLNVEDWAACFDEEGRLADDPYKAARVKMFNGGIDESIRGEVWGFLLNRHRADSTRAQREAQRKTDAEEYNVYKSQWKSITEQQEAHFSAYRDRKGAIEKDVMRTDRTHPEFASEESELRDVMYDVLMSYAMFNFDIGYCQGMSDLVSVLLLIYRGDEVEVFCVFRALLVEKCQGNFAADVGIGMGVQLKQVAELIRAFVPTLFAHFEKNHAEGMGFCFRWLLVLFKRELEVHEVMLLWDVLFSSPYTKQYEIVVAAALLRHVSAQIFEQSLQYDELLKFTNNMSGGVMKVNDVIVITHDFYDYIASQMAWRGGGGGGRRGARHAGENKAAVAKPKLEDILEAYKPTPPGSPSASSLSQSSPTATPSATSRGGGGAGGAGGRKKW